jgi:hypothetical protein
VGGDPNPSAITLAETADLVRDPLQRPAPLLALAA